MAHLKLNSRAFTDKMDAYILSCINTEEYTPEQFTTDQERLKFVFDTFKREYCYPANLKRYGTPERCFKEWLMGLPSVVSVEYMNVSILDKARELGSYKDTSGMSAKSIERYEDSIIAYWFTLCAQSFFRLCRKNGVNTSI